MSKELYANAALHRFVRYDARTEIVRSIGDLSRIELFGNIVLVAPYVTSGLLLPRDAASADAAEEMSCEALYERLDSGTGLRANTLSRENIYQGKVCLVLKIGCDVDVDDPKYGGDPLSVGDWIFTLQENTRGVSIAAPGAKQSKVLKALDIDYVGWPCKLLDAVDIYGRIDDPNVLA